jgi:hypothetical protein
MAMPEWTSEKSLLTGRRSKKYDYGHLAVSIFMVVVLVSRGRAEF